MTALIALMVIPLMPDYPLQSKHMVISREHQALAVN